MYAPLWLMLTAVSLGMSVLAFIWALQTGQFSDQGRARRLPLRDEPLPPPANDPATARSRKIQGLALAAVGLMGLIAMLAALALSLYRMKG